MFSRFHFPFLLMMNIKVSDEGIEEVMTRRFPFETDKKEFSSTARKKRERKTTFEDEESLFE
jgi:hypothetical protein